MADLPEKQAQILSFLQSFIDDSNYPPSIRDIQDGCWISSTSVVDYNLRKLEEKGYIRRDREVSRAIEILGSRRRARVIEVPVLGSIAAGQPIPVPTSDRWSADVDEVLAVTEDMVRGHSQVFALRVCGTSMIEDLIDDGDIVFLDPARSVNEGDKVAVWLKDRGEVTLKRIYHEGTPSRMSLLEWKQQQDHLGRVLEMEWVWPSRRRGWLPNSTLRITKSLTITRMSWSPTVI